MAKNMIPTHASYLADVARAAHQTGKNLSLDEVGAVIDAINALGAADETVARTGNTADHQGAWFAGLEQGQANAQHNAAIRGGADWLPIESAPKDGTEFQAWLNMGVWEPRCRFNPASEAFEIWDRVDYDRDDWDACGHLTATHWMPKPTAPVCPTCNDQGAVGNILTAQPCPDCAAPGVSTVEDAPAAYLTLDEEGSPCMLFFDQVEARTYCALGEEPEALYRRPAPAAGDALTAAARDVLAERQRQVSAEGWTPEQDDRYTHGDMASAAACYANQGRYHFPEPGKPGPNWPWAAEWWKPSTYRRNLEKAGALILAEIERLDRAAVAAQRKGDA